jgi:putative hydrolase of the HAD superfamily
MNNIKAVIFDVDGTLVDRNAAFLKFCDYLIDKYSPDYPYHGTKEDLISYMIEIDENGYGGIANFIPRLTPKWKLPHTVQEYIEERNKIFGTMVEPYPELYEVLDALKENYKLGIITNGYSTVQRDKIKTAKISHYFDDIIVSGETEHEKPDPDIFALSCRHLGINPKEAVFVGDYFPNDIEGAIRVGMIPVWINDDPKEHSEYKGIRIKRLKDILKVLQEC